MLLYTDEEITKRKKKEKNIKNIITILVYIILVPLLVYNISLIVQAVINPRETPNFFGVKSYVIISGSMQPNLNIGDVVIVKQTEDLQVGDIISFRRGQAVVTHRITEIIDTDENKVLFKTKGDFNNVEDTELVTEELIEGEVVNYIPNVGKISLFLKNKTVIICIIVFYYIYLLHSESKQKKKKTREKKRIQHEEQKIKEKINENIRT